MVAEERITDSERINTAYHEAGHAVIAVITNQLAGPVSIVPDEILLGRTRLRADWRSYRGWGATLKTPGLQVVLRRAALIDFAAYAAEALDDADGIPFDPLDLIEYVWWRNASGSSPGQHIVDLYDLLTEFHVPNPEDFIEQAGRAVERLFSRSPLKRAVRAVAQELLEHDTLDDDETTAIVARALGPADGRLYQSIFEMEHDERVCIGCGAPLWWADPRARRCRPRCRARAGHRSDGEAL